VLESIGLSTRAEEVYRAMLGNPTWGVDELVQRLGIPETECREVLDLLVDLALIRPSPGQDGTLRLVSPQAGLAGLLARAEADVLARQKQIEATRAAVEALAAEHAGASRSHVEVIRHEDVDAVRARLEDLAGSARSECLSFSPGGGLTAETMQASRPLNQAALARGVSVRNVYQESFRNDPATLAFARWMAERGSQSRTVPVVPLKMVVVDAEVALVPIDPADTRRGALEIQSPGLIAALCLLFEAIWEQATPFGDPPPVSAEGLEPVERELIRLLGNGHTDEAAGRRLGLSVRTVRRLMADLHQRLAATSRFQAGAEAVRRGWL
jgi:DNA-binding CsgD family transcriptional regulator/sugar-specific transcriptional regulator TrmB